MGYIWANLFQIRLIYDTNRTSILGMNFFPIQVQGELDKNKRCFEMKIVGRWNWRRDFVSLTQISLLFFKQIQPSTAWLLFQKHPLFPTSYLKLINTIYSLILFIFYRQPIWAKRQHKKVCWLIYLFKKSDLYYGWLMFLFVALNSTI